MLEENVDEKYYLDDNKIEKISHWKSFQKPFEKVNGNNSIVQTLTARGAGEEHSGMITYSERLEETTNLQEECLNIKSGSYARNFGSKGKLQDKEYCDTLTASMGTGGGNVPILRIKNNTKLGYLETQVGDGIYTNTSTKRGTVQKEMIPTLTTFQDKGVVMNDLRIRKLTPKECWRLMGFDDTDFEKAQKVNSNAQLYKQAGNSIVVNVLEAILKNLIKEK